MYSVLKKGAAIVNGELSYLIQFNDTNEPSFVNCSASRIWSPLIFDFWMDKFKYDGFEDVVPDTVNILENTDVSHGQAEIVCKCSLRFIGIHCNYS